MLGATRSEAETWESHCGPIYQPGGCKAPPPHMYRAPPVGTEPSVGLCMAKIHPGPHSEPWQKCPPPGQPVCYLHSNCRQIQRSSQGRVSVSSQAPCHTKHLSLFYHGKRSPHLQPRHQTLPKSSRGRGWDGEHGDALPSSPDRAPAPWMSGTCPSGRRRWRA